MKIALIDDDVTTNFINKIKLKKHIPTCEVVIFENGKQALDYLKKGNKINVAILDLNMPIMNGMQFLKAHSNLEYSNKIDKIVLFIEQKIEAKFKLDNDIYLALQKPLTQQKIELIFSENKIIDSKIVKNLEPEILIQALSIFKRNSQVEIEKLTELYKKNEIEKLKKIAHKLRGSSISVGLKGFSDLAEKIENNKKNEELGILLSNLNVYYKKVLVFLDKKYGV